MNRSNYDSKVLSNFDVIGSFIVDIFYNDLYLKARDHVKEGRQKSITDAYRTNVINYMHGIKQQQFYMRVVRSLHEYYQKVTVFSTLIFSDFENKILNQFIPPEYFQYYTERDKDSNLCAIITQTVQEFGENVLKSEIIRKIIDNHFNEANITLLQDIVIEILMQKREEYYVQFTKKINQRSGKVSEEVVQKIKSELVREVSRRCESEQNLERATNIIKQLINRVKALEIENEKLRNKPPAPLNENITDFLLSDSQNVVNRTKKPVHYQNEDINNKMNKNQSYIQEEFTNEEFVGEKFDGEKSNRKFDGEKSNRKSDGEKSNRKFDGEKSDSEESDSGESDSEELQQKQREMIAKRVSERAQTKQQNNFENNEEPKSQIDLTFGVDDMDDPGFGF